MGLLDKLSKYKSGTIYVDEIISSLKGLDENLYVFGAGDRAQWIGKVLMRDGINFKGFLVNESYYAVNTRANMYGYEKNIYCYENVIEEKSGLIIILGIPQSVLDMSMFEIDAIQKVIPINLGNRDDYLMDLNVLQEHEDALEWLYDNLEDEYSKECLIYCLRGRLTGRDYDFVPSKWSDPEYFLDELIEWGEKECIVDCGAFDGDTIAEFLTKKPSDNNFEYKIYAWEPDNVNFSKLRNEYESNNKIICINKATYSETGTLGFLSAGEECSAVINGGNASVVTDTIDLVLNNEKATFIKMDIEGSELKALMGAKEQIVHNKPRLAICLYHKQEDFWTIPQYIKRLNPEYKIFLRSHSSMPTELVLFCI